MLESYTQLLLNFMEVTGTGHQYYTVAIVGLWYFIPTLLFSILVTSLIKKITEHKGVNKK